ncbi:hypothetical protein EUGRSUZ_C02655 [Eucalyptus grandis]|uniref:Uncharacterized protein n=2 Tax=Eucalyptus grandis TaxID=71139 RepID=A0A059CS24_EUCGR|nr:hypothetical protein EUGRSUZ_C02655 [Eucalyptus grandis]
METSDRNYAIAAVQNIVGIDDRIKHVTDLLEMEVNDEVRIIGIYGTDGIGKTTLAKAVYDQISSCFDRCCFLAEVEETTRNPHGIQILHNKMIRDILERDREDPSFDGRIEIFLHVFREMKVLIVVDDVQKQSHLHAIVGDQIHWFGLGSRIIVTSKNSEILKEYDLGKARTYMVRQLENGQAFELFCKYAFRMQSSVHGYDELANHIVNATVKLPLAVEVIGSFLRGKSVEEWKKMEELMKQSLTSSQKTMVGCQEILDICYKALDPKQKHIFLDIACFISGVDAQIASYMWPNPYLPSFDCILMPLAKIGENNELQMHRLLRCLGEKVLDQEESEDPIPRKFYMRDMVSNAVSREEGMENVEALCFDLDDHASCTFTAGDFESMPCIRFLKLDNAKVSGDFAGAFPSLRHLRIDTVWVSVLALQMEKLKILNLTGCSDLMITPDFSGYKDLEILILESCPRLVKLDSSIGHLKRLVSLNLKFCSQLNSYLKQLQILIAFNCFPLVRLPGSISYLTALSILSLDGAKITELPSSLGEMLNLKRLSLRDCSYMQELPDSIGRMGSSLEELDISATSISKLPNSIRYLQNLRVLRMDSSFVRAFPGEIGNLTMLEELHASLCRSLKGAIPSDIKRLHHLRSLTLGHSGISSLPSEICRVSSLHTLDLLQCNEIEVLPELPPSLICLRVSSKRMKAIALLKDLKELEELCLRDEDPKEHRSPSKQLMPESKGRQLFATWFSRLRNVELLQTTRIDQQSFSISSPKLRKLELCLSQIMNLHFVYEPTDVPQLKKLTLSGLSLEKVSELPKTLSVLSIRGCSSLKRLPTVQGLTNMSVFELYHSAIEEIEGLEGLKALKRLDISNCRIQNLNGIDQLTSLRSLILSNCDYLDNLPDLSNLMLLKILEIRQCKMIHQIEGLEDLASLEELNISECPAEYLVEVQNALKHVMARSRVT